MPPPCSRQRGRDMTASVMTPGHRLLRAVVAAGDRRFRRGLNDMERIQRGNLASVLRRVARVTDGAVGAHWHWEDFAARFPITGYEDWRQGILQQRQDGQCRLTASPVRRYQPTSGSSSAVKWIPYTRDFLGELDGAISPWIADLYRQWPGVGAGRHYWSMSWIPTSLRADMNSDVNDDMKVMSAGKRLLAGWTQAVPQEVSLAGTSEDSLFATLAYLAADERLSLISIWSPTFGLSLLESLSEWREELVDVLRQGSWGARTEGIGRMPAPLSFRAADKLSRWNGELSPAFFMELWPQLSLVSAWDTAASAPWAERLQSLLPHAGFQGKGLWATEGTVTFPWRGRFPLAYRSHVYEFRDLNDDRVLAPWQLRVGQEVMPLLTTGSGLLRYAMNDMMRVDGFLGSVPCLQFLGRNDGTDLVGEKISVGMVQDILDDLDYRGLIRPLSLVAKDDACNGKPGYCLLTEPVGEISAEQLSAQLRSTTEALEHRLLRHFHYRLARDLGQLAPARILCHHRMRDVYLEQCRRQGMIEGNIKIEVLRHWGRQLKLDLPELLSVSAVGGARVSA